MRERAFDIDDTSIAFDAKTRELAMTVQPAVRAYDEAALILHGWGVFAGCPELRRLVVKIENRALGEDD